MAQKRLSDKISHSSFEVGDVGLFMPTGRGSGGKRTYLAFHTNCPHRFLSTDCIRGTPDFVLGRIVYVEELVAGELGTDANPYGLHIGTKFWVLTVEVLKP
jgi:Autophagy-related protein 11